MKLESQVSNLELSKRLKELGVKQESLFWWYDLGSNYRLQQLDEKERLSQYAISAFTVAELGELIGWGHLSGKNELGKWECWCKDYSLTADTEADARAKMLIYLLEQKLV